MQTYMTVKRIRNAPHPPAASGLILFLNGISRFGAFAIGERAVFYINFAHIHISKNTVRTKRAKKPNSR